MCGYSWPNSAAKSSDCQLTLLYFDGIFYKVIAHIFEGLLQKIFFPLIKKFLQNCGKQLLLGYNSNLLCKLF